MFVLAWNQPPSEPRYSILPTNVFGSVHPLPTVIDVSPRTRPGAVFYSLMTVLSEKVQATLRVGTLVSVTS